MHALHTTPAFILSSHPHGESNRVHKLFTREFGMLIAHGQGVRELRNRNRYGLRTHALVLVTLVRGREVWRLTSARAEHGTSATLAWRRVLAFAARLLAAEDPAPRVFDLLVERRRAFADLPSERVATLEALSVLEVLNELGYVARPRASFVETLLADAAGGRIVLADLEPRRQELLAAVNEAMRELPVR